MPRPWEGGVRDPGVGSSALKSQASGCGAHAGVRSAPVSVSGNRPPRGGSRYRVDLMTLSIPSTAARQTSDDHPLTTRRPLVKLLLTSGGVSNPTIRDAVARATFEHLVGFQLTDVQLRYNATR